MAKETRNEKTIQDVVKALSLHEFYPEKITSEDLYEIRELSIKETENITPGTICWIFINRLTRNNYKARNLKIGAETNETKPSGYLQRKRQEHMEKVTQFHPLDIIAAVYVCCDPLAKQDLVRFMWGCKLSVPFILGWDNHNSPVVNQWPLRAVITQWPENEKATATEHSVIRYPMQKIGLVRIGELDESKSALLNGIIGGPEKGHPMFFHRDLHGSQTSRSILVEGLVELGWFFPKGVESDRFDSCKLFANMRGDASKCSKQFKFLLQTMDLILVISHTKYFKSQIDTFCNAVARGAKVILILTDKNTEQLDDDIKTLLNHIGTYDVANFEILPLENHRLAAKLDFICDNIKKMEMKSYSSLEDVLLKSKLDLKTDENSNENIISSVQYVRHVISKVDKNVTSSGKKDILPLQCDTWKKWTETEIEIYKLEKFSRETTGDISTYLNSLEEEKIKLRKQQFDMLENKLYAAWYFIQCILYLKDGALKVFLRTLKLELDEISRKMHRPFYEQYKVILEEKKNADEQRNNELNENLERLDKEKAAVSIGLEHYIRELGQIYEACANQSNASFKLCIGNKKYMPYSRLSDLASKILLGGYPIEIMDGDVGFVPEQWMTEVLRSLQHQLDENDAQLHVISVLGIQSSGKSTLLNTLFGLQFAVSAGRCTKGVFMQMVKVSASLRSRFKCDYILAIDTEGLRAAHASTKFDNELSCFAIGLADLTIVNLMGENAKYLEENLPVVVHAFLRMDMAGLKPQCILVHQNVDKTNKDKLMEQTRLLEKVLDELTAKACDIEGIKPHKRFKDIISFNVSDSTYYIPGLLEGDQPMGPISVGYSQECNALRIGLLQRCEQKSRHLTITDFAGHLSNLWNAMKTDQFVFNFRTTAETQTSLQLEEFYSEIYSSLLEAISSLAEVTHSNITRRFCLKEQLEPDINKTLEHDISEIGKEHRQRLITYIEGQNTSYSKIMHEWKDAKLTRYDSDFADAKRDCLHQLAKACVKYQTTKRTVDVLDVDDISELNKIVQEEIKHKSPTDTESIVATKIWTRWSSEKFKHSPDAHMDTPDIKRDVEAFLLEMFESDRHRLEKALGKNDTRGKLPQTFQITSTHISKSRQVFDVLHLTSSKEDIQMIADIIMTNAQQEIEHIGSSKQAYTKSDIKRILLKMKQILQRQKKVFTKDFKIDIYVHLSNFLVNAFSNLYEQETLEETTSLAYQKTNIIALIKSMMKEKKNEVQNLCADQITNYLREKVVRTTLANLHNRTTCLEPLRTKSKRKCIDYLLSTAILNKAFELVDLYLKDPEEALLQMLMTCIKTDQLTEDALSDSKRRIRLFQNEMKKFHVSRGTKVEEFIFLTFKTAKLDISENTYVKAVQAVDIDILKLRKDLTERIKALEGSEMLNEMLKRKKTHDDAIKRKAAESFLTKKLGCLEKCPFCGEICMYDTVNHVGHHQAARHRPLGYNNMYYVQSKKLVLDICSILVRSNTVLHDGENCIPFNDFGKFYPNWIIRAHDHNNVSMLWKWYFATHFKSKFSRKHKTITVIVPTSWTHITEDEVVQSLTLSSTIPDPLSVVPQPRRGETPI